ncbi:alpha/beta fold hydrolase [Pseudomonas syringae group sp. J309-1]|uniref:alpha/beta fold hydrolase n=1 Tax=Pseudomonas syringae group sp. J309-1 TaxID=3079588 RepID=UPI00041E09D2|nr:alpha/beta hydrolase [Pseudomonas syringae group sp. J309-1]MCQ3034041.1 alpha/beta hydrolase [Pseudomonas syringae]MDG6400420.1 alpha/beta hydrolase [Pseudomonas quasicaspiana]MDU8360983.1 alpha/beta hydrolase [Pseudomonas syringae group sp. J309-1]
MAHFEHDGCSLHYEEYGQGPPLLLLHGLGSSCRDWEYQIPAFAARYRVIAMDMRGHGRSDKPRERYSIRGFSADVEALIEHLNLGQVHVLGLSMGGMIGFQLAVDYPHLLKSLCIVNSAPQVKVRSANDVWQYTKRWVLARLLGMRTLGNAVSHNLFPKPEHAHLRHLMAERFASNDKRAYLASFDAIVGWGVEHKLSRITCPTLVISADRDYTPVALKEAYVGLIPNARLVVIKDSRHATPLEHPEQFNRIALEFIDAVQADVNV